MRFLLLLCFLPILALAREVEYSGWVKSVSDGDTFTLLTAGNESLTIRLADIDAPESGQPYGNKAKRTLQTLVLKKNIKAICRDQDRYGRFVCTVFVDNRDVNLEMVSIGHAWVYDLYNARDDLPVAEKNAKLKKSGLWGLPESQIINPQEWRKSQQEVQAQVTAQRSIQQRSASFTCGAKQYCSQMASCEEAMFHLNSCGLSRLDGNSDGSPCEKLCATGQ